MNHMTLSVMTLVTPILTEMNMTLMTRTLTMWARTLLMMKIISIQTGILMPAIITDAYNIEYDAGNGATDADGFGAENSRANNVGTDNYDGDIDASHADDSNSGSNDNGDPEDTDDHHDPVILSDSVQPLLDLVILVVYVHLKP